MRASLVLCALMLMLSSVGCGDDDGNAVTSGGESCDPLLGRERTIAFADVLAVGRDADAVVYVVDRTSEGALRAFVSHDDVLQRQRVLGEASGSTGAGTSYAVDVDADPAFSLHIEISNEGETRFTKSATVGRDTADAGADAGADHEQLELLSEDDLADFTLRDLPPDVVVEYFGAFEDGRRVVVIRPTDDWTYDDFRVFIGAPSHVLEREVQSVTRARDGGSTTIELTLDGEPATLSFPVMLVDGGIVAGPATFEQGDQTLDIELLDKTVSALMELAFFCR